MAEQFRAGGARRAVGKGYLVGGDSGVCESHTTRTDYKPVVTTVRQHNGARREDSWPEPHEPHGLRPLNGGGLVTQVDPAAENRSHPCALLANATQSVMAGHKMVHAVGLA